MVHGHTNRIRGDVSGRAVYQDEIFVEQFLVRNIMITK